MRYPALIHPVPRGTISYHSSPPPHPSILSPQVNAVMLAFTGSMAVTISFIQRTTSWTEFENASLRSWEVLITVSCSLSLLFFGAWWLAVEMAPKSMGEFDSAFDNNLRWEAESRDLVWRSWLVPGSYWRLRPEVLSVLRMYGFWGLVWGVKNAAAISVLHPTVYEAHIALLAAMPDGVGTSVLEPAMLLRRWLQVVAWITCMNCYVADTLLWYHITLALVGFPSRAWERGVRFGAWVADPAFIAEAAATKILQGSETAWGPIWERVLSELYTLDLITKGERAELTAASSQGTRPLTAGVPANPEARRRLQFLSRSLTDPRMADSTGLLSAPGMTVLVPHYGESIITSMVELLGVEAVAEASQVPKPTMGEIARRSSRGGSVAKTSVMGFIVAYKPDEFRNFESRMLAQQLDPGQGG